MCVSEIEAGMISAAFTSAVTTTDSPSFVDAFPEHTGGYVNEAFDAIPDILSNKNNTGEPYMLD